MQYLHLNVTLPFLWPFWHVTVVCGGISGVVVTTAIIMHISYFSYLTATLHSIDKKSWICWCANWSWHRQLWVRNKSVRWRHLILNKSGNVCNVQPSFQISTLFQRCFNGASTTWTWAKCANKTLTGMFPHLGLVHACCELTKLNYQKNTRL